MRAGLPRCLSYFYLSPLYSTFLSELGVEVVESAATAARDLERLSLCPTDEPCISVKIAFGHAKQLLDAGVDVLFVPTVVSLTGASYCCPKMMGLPSMLRAGLELDSSRVASPVIDMKDDPRRWPLSWVTAAWSLGVRDASLALRALRKGLIAWRDEEARKVSAGARLVSGSDSGTLGHGRPPVTGVMGHAYILEDIFGRRVVEVARGYGEVILAEMVPPEDARAELDTIFDGEKMWSIEGQILGASLRLVRRRQVDRLVFVSAFSCGPASIIENYIAREAESHGVPLLNLAVDEHSGEAGLVTRLEAFLDSSVRRKRLLASRCPSEAEHGQADPVRQPAQDCVSATLRNTSTTEGAGDGPIGLVSMGNLNVPVATLLTTIGVEVVPPPPLCDDIVNLGKEISPEFICYPMVTLIGQMRRHAESGVTRVLMVQGKGRCRLGWYAQVMEEILHRNGYPVSVVSFDSPLPLRTRGKAAVESIRRLAGKVEPLRIVRAVELAFAKLAALDRASVLLRDTRAVEAIRGAGDRRYRAFVREMETAATLVGIAQLYRRYASDMRALPVVDCDALNVAVVGEIYVVNEPFVNKDAERVLGSLERRVRVHRKIDVCGWVSYHLLRTPRAVRNYRAVTGFAEPYLPLSVGGHGQESVGETVLARRKGYDGVLHLFPFTCMPEIIAQNILVKVSTDLDIPVLSLMISEQTGAAGLTTRLEAFCDLLDGRRKRRNTHGARR